MISKKEFQSIQEKCLAEDWQMKELLRLQEVISADEILEKSHEEKVKEVMRTRHEQRWEEIDVKLEGLTETEQKLYPFYLLLSCIYPSLEYMLKRGIPEEYFNEIPYFFAKMQFERWAKDGDCEVKDFGWEANYYTCSLHRFDRINFIPERMDDNVFVYRRKEDRSIIAFSKAGDHCDAEGKYMAEEEGSAFTTVWQEDDNSITANAFHPLGHIEKETSTIVKEEYDYVLGEDDIVIGFHIPSGEGYNIERVKHSMQIARAFFEKYFPDLDFKAFSSGSWLYNPHLAYVLQDKASGIADIQRQFFRLTVDWGDEQMVDDHMYGKSALDKAGRKSRLKEGIEKYRALGMRFETMGMFFLIDDLDDFGKMPYLKEEEEKAYFDYLDKKFARREVEKEHAE